MSASKSAKWKMQHADKYRHYIQSPQTAVTVPQCTKSQINLNTTEVGQDTMATEAEAAPTGAGDPTRATGPNLGKTTGTVQHRYVEIVGEPHTTPDKNAEP